MRSILMVATALALVGAFGADASAQKDKKANTLKVGEKAPAFESVDDQGKAFKSSDVVGKKVVVLYFYPGDLTPGCTKQACGYRDDIEKLAGQGVEVIGVSGDSAENHRLFKKVHKLPFTLLADEKGEVAKKFGVPVGEGKSFEFKAADGTTTRLTRAANISRYTVVIDKNGTIVAIDAVSDAAGDPRRIANLVKSLPQ